MPPNTVKVDRTTKWGNPFIVGRDGTREECVKLFTYMLGGYICLTSKASIEAQESYRAHVKRYKHLLRGKNLACWCPAGTACHVDVLLGLKHSV
jgi:hypothetical protein